MAHVARGHDFSADELELAVTTWTVWPRAEQPRVFQPHEAIERALRSRKDPHGYPSLRVDTSMIVDGWRRTDNLLTREEAAFWFSILVTDGYSRGQVSIITPLWVRRRSGRYKADTPARDFIEALEKSCFIRVMNSWSHGSGWIGPLGVLLRLLRDLVPYEDALEFVLAHAPRWYIGQWVESLGPPRDAEEREAALARVEPVWSWLFDGGARVERDTATFFSMIPCSAGIEAALKPFVEGERPWTTDAIEIALHLDDPAVILQSLQGVAREKDRAMTRSQITRFIARVDPDLEHLDTLLDLALPCRDLDEFEETLQGILSIRAPEVVERLYNVLENPNHEALFDAYLSSDDPAILEGLLRLCKSRSKKRIWALERLRACAREHPASVQTMRDLASSHDDRVQKLIARAFGEPDAGDAKESPLASNGGESVIPSDELPGWATRLAKAKWPDTIDEAKGDLDWLGVGMLPALHLDDEDGRALPRDVLEGMFATAYCIWAQKYCSNQKQLEGDLTALFSSTRQGSARHLLLELLRVWGPSRELDHGRWILRLAGKFGDGAIAEALEDYVRARRSNKELHADLAMLKLAIKQLLALDLPEGRYALRKLSREHPNEMMRSIAARAILDYCSEHDLSEDDYIEISVPDFGLGTNGRMRFDLGSRQLDLVMRGRDALVFEDIESEKIYKRFPTRKKSDDPDRHAAAKSTYKRIRAPLLGLFEEQGAWFERAMMLGRTWDAERWQVRILSHPILGHFARRLVWAVLEDGARVELVLPDAEGTLMDVAMDNVTLTPAQQLTLVHPSTLSDQERRAWLIQLAEFELLQPFDQIDRALYCKDNMQEQVERFGGELDQQILIDACERGWEPYFSGRKMFRLLYKAPGDAFWICLGLEGDYPRGDEDRLRPSKGACRVTSVVSRESYDKVDVVLFHSYDKEVDPTHLDKVSERAWSEATRLILLANGNL